MKKPSAEVVFEAVCDLHSEERAVTRETLAQITGLKLSVVDDRLGVLVDDGLIHRVQRGVYVPAAQHPPARLISKTILPDGSVKIEIGDDVLTLTPRESRALGEIQAGAAHQYIEIEAHHYLAESLGELWLAHKAIRRRVRELEALLEGSSPKVQSGSPAPRSARNSSACDQADG